jgi:hypothetical protein
LQQNIVRGLAAAVRVLVEAGTHDVHQAEGEDVAARVGFFALQLLRRHVLQSACDEALPGQRRRRRRQRREIAGGILRFDGFRQTEIEQLRARLG